MLGARAGQPRGGDSWGKEGGFGAERGNSGEECECLEHGMEGLGRGKGKRQGSRFAV